jgi:hypothetical protein
VSSAYRVGSILVEDDGRNLRISKTHTPSEAIVVESADRADLLAALISAEDRRADLGEPATQRGSLWRAPVDSDESETKSRVTPGDGHRFESYQRAELAGFCCHCAATKSEHVGGAS